MRSTRPGSTTSMAWKRYLRAVMMQSGAYLTLCVAFILFSFATLLPLFRHLLTHWPGNILCGLITLLAVSPCVRPIVMRRSHSANAILIRHSGQIHTFFFFMVTAIRFIVGCSVIYYILNFLSPYWWVWHIMASAALMLLIIASRTIKWLSIRLERTFIQNLKSREQNSGYGRRLMGQDLHIARVEVPLNTRWGGRTLAELNLGSSEHINVVAVIRGHLRINIPSATNRIYPGDVIEVAGDDASIGRLQNRLQDEVYNPDAKDIPQNALTLLRLTLDNGSMLCGHTLVDTNFRTRYSCMVIGRELDGGELTMVEPQRLFEPGDILWVVGEDHNIKSLRIIMSNE